MYIPILIAERSSKSCVSQHHYSVKKQKHPHTFTAKSVGMLNFFISSSHFTA